MNSPVPFVEGAGLGLRRALLDPLSTLEPGQVDFMEVAPENWIGVGGRYAHRFRQYAERFPFLCHGLSLSIGSTMPLDWNLLKNIKSFMSAFNIRGYSEHLSYSSDAGHLYDLMPIPFTEQAVRHVAIRILQVQDFLGQRIMMENVSYYAAPRQDMSEIEFLNAVLAEADCDLLLDVNNVFVNSINHGYDAEQFIKDVPGERIRYLHVAGHHVEAEDLRIDSHGSDVIDPVWQLLETTYQLYGNLPTLLERDFNMPPVEALLSEVAHIRHCQQRHAKDGSHREAATA